MKILVAGGAGFIGSHLSERLLAMGHDVMVLDNLKTGSLKNLKAAKRSNRFTFIKGDVRQPWSRKVDYIFNLASYASPPYYQTWSIDTLMTNAYGSHLLLEAAKKYKAHYLLASTSEVYGDPLHHPQVETDWGNVNPIGLRSCYDEAKRFSEALTMEYIRKHGVNARIIRIFNTYGPRLQKDDGRVISNFINQALNHRPLTIFGDGRQTRSFCYVEDLVEGIIKAAFTPKTKGEVFNLGNPHEFTMLEAADLIEEVLGTKVRRVFKPLPSDDPKRRKPNIQKAKNKLKWTPQIPLRQGLIKTIAWFRETAQSSKAAQRRRH